MGKDVFAEMFRGGETPKAVVARLGLVQESDTGVIDDYVRQAIEQGAAAVAEYRAGKQKALQALVGQVMKLSRGKANPQLVVKALRGRLG
jgi:aspartyl-tRNA(Asn)/glutamyl-tRNA(Gln) amidotransferase subunit B